MTADEVLEKMKNLRNQPFNEPEEKYYKEIMATIDKQIEYGDKSFYIKNNILTPRIEERLIKDGFLLDKRDEITSITPKTISAIINKLFYALR